MLRLAICLVIAGEALLLLRVLSRWLPLGERNRALRLLAAIVDPPLRLLGRALPLRAGGIDLSPAFLIFALEILRNTLRALGGEEG
ncbi:MAG: YggT family protein [Planctomycetota bacterium]